MLLAALVLVSVQREHDGLEKGVDFGQADESAEVGDMAGLGLEEEKEIRVLLEFAIIGIVALCGIDVFQCALDLALLDWI